MKASAIERRLLENVHEVTPLVENVAEWIAEHAAEYGGDDWREQVQSVLEDLAQGGCASGMVGHLIYHTDIAEWFKVHGRECEAIVQELCSGTGCTPAELFERAGWDGDDPFARGDVNRSILAWAGFEETARNIGLANDIDL